MEWERDFEHCTYDFCIWLVVWNINLIFHISGRINPIGSCVFSCFFFSSPWSTIHHPRFKTALRESAHQDDVQALRDLCKGFFQSFRSSLAKVQLRMALLRCLLGSTRIVVKPPLWRKSRCGFLHENAVRQFSDLSAERSQKLRQLQGIFVGNRQLWFKVALIQLLTFVWLVKWI